MSAIVSRALGGGLAIIKARRYYRKAKPYLPVAIPATRNLATMAYRSFRKRRMSRALVRRVRRKKAAFRPPNFNAGTAHTKSVNNVTDATTTSTLQAGNMVSIDLTDIDHSTTNSMDNRHGHVINLRGFHWCAEVSNQEPTDMYFNWAIVVPKPGAATPGGSTVAEFFRNEDSEPRSKDFDRTTMSGVRMHCAKINIDAYYVICHKRHKLGGLINGAATSTLNNKNNSTITIDRYIKYNRQIRYNDATDNEARAGKPYLVYWCSPTNYGAHNGISWDWDTQVVTLFRHCKTYFNEPRNS